jgi:hypothetical protein
LIRGRKVVIETAVSRTCELVLMASLGVIIIWLYGTNGYYTCGQYSNGNGEMFAFHGCTYYEKSLREVWNTGHVSLFGMKGYM